METLDIKNDMPNNMEIEKKQKNFLQTRLGKAINSGLNIGLRYALPDIIEDEIINIKDEIIENGFKEGVNTAINSAVNLGKSTLGIVTGNFENVEQMRDAVKSGGIIDSISNVINFAINKIVNKGKISYSLGNTIKKGKNVILSNITKNIENEFENQIKNIEKINKYNENWKNYFNNKDFDVMQREYEKIKDKIKEIAPIEKAIQTSRTIENLHKLIKNNGKNFDLSQDEMELIQMLN